MSLSKPYVPIPHWEVWQRSFGRPFSHCTPLLWRSGLVRCSARVQLEPVSLSGSSFTNYNTSRSTPTFFQTSVKFYFCGFVLCLNLLCHAPDYIWNWLQRLCRGCRRHRSVSQNSPITLWFVMEKKKELTGITFRILNGALWEWMKLDSVV